MNFEKFFLTKILLSKDMHSRYKHYEILYTDKQEKNNKSPEKIKYPDFTNENYNEDF